MLVCSLLFNSIENPLSAHYIKDTAQYYLTFDIDQTMVVCSLPLLKNRLLSVLKIVKINIDY